MPDDKKPGRSGLVARTIAAVAIASFWCISAVGTTVGTTVGLTTLATAINAAIRTCRSTSALATRVSGSSTLAGAALAWWARTFRDLVRRLLIGTSQCPYFDVLIQRSRQALSCEALHHRP